MKMKILMSLLVSAFVVAGCGNRAEDKISTALNTTVHPLNETERPLAQMNAKAYFEKEFPVEKEGELKKERGAFLECRPSDSNFNGLVTCKGMVPQPKGGYREVTRYCGYRPELVGCSDEDTVAK